MNASLYLGKSTELLITSKLLFENRETYLPTVDDHGVDIIVKTKNFEKGDGSKANHYEYQEIQVKSLNEGGLFAAFYCTPKPNYWFVFYIRSIDTIWLINSYDVHKMSSINSPESKNAGKHSINLANKKAGPSKKFEKYIVSDFSNLP